MRPNAAIRVTGRVVALAMGVSWLSACSNDPAKGYSFASTMSSAGTSRVRTIAVPMFENATFAPGMEATLTEAIIKELQRSTDVRVVSNGAADTQLKGVIRGENLHQTARDSQTGFVDQLAVELRVDFDWTDQRTGEVLVSRRGFAAVDTFVPARGTGERLAMGERAAIDRLAKDLVRELQTQW